jgi:hypothetical protein
MKRYKIADILPREWRAVMVEAGPYLGGAIPGLGPTNRKGYCPLGVLDDAGLVEYDARAVARPGVEEATAALAEVLRRPERQIRPAVRQFVQDWDAGEIDDLAAALGLSAENS